MKNLVYIYFFEAIVLWCFVSMGLFHKNNEVYSTILVSLFSLEFLYFFYTSNKKKSDFQIVYLFMIALIFRICIMYYDIYVNTIEIADAGYYRRAAEKFFITNETTLQGGKLTSLFLGTIYKILGLQRVVLPFIGCICFLGACHLTNEILKILKIQQNIRYICIVWMLFTPQNLIVTSLSSREAYIIFLNTLSIYFCVLWWENRKVSYLVKSILFLIFSIAFHAGSIAILVGEVLLIAFYDRKKEKLCIKWNTIFVFTIAIFIFLILFYNFRDTLFWKFNNVNEISDISMRAGTEVGRGGATYSVPGAGATSLGEILFYTPIRAIYFVLSPMPWDWRGINDLGAFAICSVPHLIITILFVKEVLRKDDIDKRRNLLIVFFVSAVLVAVIFGWAVKNAGTAIRHRDKFLCLYTLLLGLGLDLNVKKKVSENEQ